jgi:muconolactone delta-isomerase
VLREREVGEGAMKYLVNGTLHPGKSREDLVAHVKDRSISDEAWDLVRKGVITEHGYKIGQRPGFVLVIEGDSEEAVHSTVAGLPFLRDGWFDIEVDPISRFFSDLR